jgi:hypothetical protein
MVKPPARDPSDSCIAYSAKPALFMPEKTKRASAPERVLHMGFFALLPSGQPPLLGAGPLRTGLESFPSSGSSIQ